jgi:hypothetical protein
VLFCLLYSWLRIEVLIACKCAVKEADRSNTDKNTGTNLQSSRKQPKGHSIKGQDLEQ